MKKHTLNPENLKVETFATFNEALDTNPTGCICDMAPCGCTKGPDCTQG